MDEGGGVEGMDETEDNAVVPISPRPGSVPDLPSAATEVLTTFPSWGLAQRTEYLQMLVNSMTLADQVSLARVLEPHLRRDFFCMLPEELCWNILSSLDDRSLGRAAQVNRSWNMVLSNDFFWKRVISIRRAEHTSWATLCSTREYELSLSADSPQIPWRHKFILLKRDISRIEENWSVGRPEKKTIPCHGNGIYCLQYDAEKIITGSRDNAIKVWNIRTHEGIRELRGHDGSVLCLQFDDRKIISGSSDATVRVWDLATGQCLQVLNQHTQSVLHLRFMGNLLVTCSKDKTVMLWRSDPQTGLYEPVHVLREHRAAVNVVEFDQRYIVSASGDRTIRIWDTVTAQPVTQLKGHMRGIACLQYQGNTIVTGSSDLSVRKWNISRETCELKLEGHTELVRCVRFNERFIISGSYDKTVRVWDFYDGRQIHKLEGHENRVFRLQFDMFKIISSSQDDNIRIWDFDTKQEEREMDARKVELMLGRPLSLPSSASGPPPASSSPALSATGESETLTQPMRRLHIQSEPPM
eukprot:m.30271 g.30271  ORF g.30271 m.30271 type:complete len:526 (+) comp4688_c1_seq1:473-2050(+)